jgi:putative ABC transport system ATP-binding protein
MMIEARNVGKVYTQGDGAVAALDRVDLEIEQGDFVVVHGPSGSGKSTLLLVLGGMLRPTTGTVTFRGVDVYSLASRRRNQFRKRHVGFIFQKFFLVPYLTAFDNIRLSVVLRGNRGDHRDSIVRLAERLGIASRLAHRPAELSVGEQQRVAMARALAGGPEIILADEPTGNLDGANSAVLAEFLTEENQLGRTIVLVTHDESLLGLGNGKVQLRSGKLSSTK